MTVERLFAPGPVEVHPAVLAAMARPVLHHRSPEFRELLSSVRAGLAEVFLAPGDDVVLLTGSGSAAFEAAMLACVPARGRLVCLASGRFGERWARLARRFGFDVVEVRTPYRSEHDLEALSDALPGADAVVVVHSETSTGELHDVAAVAAAARAVARDALVLVDAVTSLAAAELRPREWGLDAVVSGSQKGVAAPPGLSFAWLSDRAWAEVEGLIPTGYLDLRAERERQREGATSATPATSLVVALSVALEQLLAGGMEARWREKDALNRAVLAAGAASGLEPFARNPSPAVAALATPAGLDAGELTKALVRRGVRVGGGQGDLRGRLLRPSLLGHATLDDLVTLVTALEGAAHEVGLLAKADCGVAVRAAKEAYEARAVG